MEHTLGVLTLWRLRYGRKVLILVLVEHTLGEARAVTTLGAQTGLNPCFSGTYSRSVENGDVLEMPASLNPCFSGTYSRRVIKKTYELKSVVLILVLVEHTLGAWRGHWKERLEKVLILVLVEHTLGARRHN